MRAKYKNQKFKINADLFKACLDECGITASEFASQVGITYEWLCKVGLSRNNKKPSSVEKQKGLNF